MRHMLMLSGVIALAIGAPALAQGKGPGNGQGNGQGRGGDAQMNAKQHGKPAKGEGRSFAKPGKDQAKADRRQAETHRQALPQPARDIEKSLDRRAKDIRKTVSDQRERAERGARRYDGDANRDFGRRQLSRGLIEGCPPGLAMKNNGCLPPGQAKKIYARNDRFASLFDRVPTRYSRYNNDYRYRDGYLYRTQGDSVVSWLPLLGGALGVGEIFPSAYTERVMPVYYNAYYGQNENYDYRYADRAIFAVDPQTQAIKSIAALLTGDDWSVGQRAPSGYSAYNVPLDYRDRYADTPDANYRYSDGHVYRIDPKTQLVAAAISLLT